MSSRKGAPPPGVKLVAKNRKALFDYEVVDRVEAGLQLLGTEVKSLRAGGIQFRDAYARVHHDEAWLEHAHIAEYSHGNVFNHDPDRARKLLLNRHEIARLKSRVEEKGMTLVPLSIYFKHGRAKVEIGLCRGKAKQDKRASIRQRDVDRAARRELED